MFTSLLVHAYASFVRKKEEARVLAAVSRVITEETHYSITGHPHVRQFENEVSKLMCGKGVVGVDSGMSALVLALRASGVTVGDEVIVPAFGFAGIPAAVCWLGARPVFVDIEDQSFAIDPHKIKEKITAHTKAIIFAHLFGLPARTVTTMRDIADAHNLILIEDIAQSFGAALYHQGSWQPVGTFGHIACCSFSSTKPFSAPGNAGAIVYADAELTQTFHRLRFYGIESEKEESVEVGVCAKLHDIHAAALLAKLPFRQYWNEYRTYVSLRYDSGLENIKGLNKPIITEDMKPIWYRYPLLTKERDRLFTTLCSPKPTNGWRYPVINYQVPLPEQPAYRIYSNGEQYPVSVRIAHEIVSPPINNHINPHEVERIIETVRLVHS